VRARRARADAVRRGRACARTGPTGAARPRQPGRGSRARRRPARRGRPRRRAFPGPGRQHHGLASRLAGAAAADRAPARPGRGRTRLPRTARADRHRALARRARGHALRRPLPSGRHHCLDRHGHGHAAAATGRQRFDAGAGDRRRAPGRRQDQRGRSGRGSGRGMSGRNDFAGTLLRWFDAHGRHDLPWQHPRSPYRTWLSEVMLQQTQVQVVLPYFERFVAELPDLPALAAAPLDRVLALWSGLGYYTRARNLHAAALRCMELHGGELPRDFDALLALPGIGRSTAGAILAQAWGDRHPILDGNVRRVLARVHGIEGWPGTPAVERRLWEIATGELPDARLADYTQAQMDFGATLCTRHEPACDACPLRDRCVAWLSGRVDELPTPKPGKPLPRRSAVVLLL